ncbi:MAG: hypothetical protein WKF79_11645 [Nocardioides sp.]
MSSRRRFLLLIAFLAVVINLPILHGSWTQSRIDRNGIEVDATVTDTATLPPRSDPKYALEFTLPSDVDPEQREWSAQVDRDTFEDAGAADSVRVRVLPDDPAAYVVPGQVSSRLGLLITLFADLVLVGMVALMWRGGQRLGPLDARVVALGDVQRGRPGGSLEQLVDDRYVVCGEVLAITDDTVVLDLGDRRVTVELNGFSNPVGYQQPARVTGRRVE